VTFDGNEWRGKVRAPFRQPSNAALEAKKKKTAAFDAVTTARITSTQATLI
jgi:hypothetical protein